MAKKTFARILVDNTHLGGTPVLGAWFAGALFVNPPVNTVLVSTLGLTEGKYIVSLFVTSTSRAIQTLEFQRRNSSNTITLQFFRLRVSNTSTFEFSPKMRFFIGQGDILRVINITAPGVGESLQCSLFTSDTVFR